MKFIDDFEVIDNKLIVKKSRDYQTQDNYIKCRKCECRRPVDRLKVLLGVPVCIDHAIAQEAPRQSYQPEVSQVVNPQIEAHKSFVNASDAPMCPSCGDICVRSGACHKCMNCGTTTGCS